MISIYQGENEDVRHNQFIGEFLLEGLCEVDAGNEILVRFGLDLNGILKVTAEEHATGLQKQLTVENAVSRFRRQSRPGGAGPALRKLVEAVALPATGGSVARRRRFGGGRRGGRSRRRGGCHRQQQRPDLQGPGRGGQGQRGGPAGDRPPGQGPDGGLGGPFGSPAQAGGGRAGGPRLLSPGRLMPPTMSTRCPDGSPDDNFVCPVCRAAQAWSDSCRRCRCDLGLLRRADEARRQARQQAIAPSSRRSLGRGAARGAGLSCPSARDRFAAFAGRMLLAGRRFSAGGGVGEGRRDRLISAGVARANAKCTRNGCCGRIQAAGSSRQKENRNASGSRSRL